MNYYIYYKVDTERLEALRETVAHIFAKVELECGVRGHWMRRSDDPTTYMEVFEGVEDEARFEKLLAALGPKTGVQRRMERFISA